MRIRHVPTKITRSKKPPRAPPTIAAVRLGEPFILDVVLEGPKSNEGRDDTTPAGMFPKTPVVVDEDDKGVDNAEEVEVSEDLDNVDDFFSNLDDDASDELSRVVSPLITNTPIFLEQHS